MSELDNKICVALDFDDTYTADPATWQSIVATMLDSGWDVRFVTFRGVEGMHFNVDIETAASVMGIPVIYTGGKQKSKVCHEEGFFPTFWIDDMPHLIPTPVQLSGILYGCLNMGDV